MNILKIVVAVGLAILYLAILLLVISQFGLGGWPLKEPLFTNPNWDRTIAVLNLIAALGSAAFGVLLGTKIEQVKVADAKKDKEAAEKDKAIIKSAASKLSEAAEKMLSEPKQNHTDFSLRSFDSTEKRLRDAIAETNAALKVT